MTNRERFRRLMNYEPVDRLPVMVFEPYEETLLTRWRQEGLPPAVTPQEHFGMDQFRGVPVDFTAHPPFDTRVIAEDDQYRVQLDWMGTTVRRLKKAPTMYYGHIDHPVKTRADWDRYRQRFVPDRTTRLPADFRRLRESTDPVSLCPFPFFFRLGFYAMGMDRFLTAFHDEPDLIRDMFGCWAEFVETLIRPVLAAGVVDVLIIAEDLAYKTSTHISPAMYAAFWYPHQDRIIDLAAKHGVSTVALWTSGNFEPLLPGLLDHGFNCSWPLERQAAGIDAVALRRKYGRRLRLAGNIAKEAVIAGPAAIDREIERLRPVIHDGGFIPAFDDMVPEEVPFAHYAHLVDALRAIKP